MRENIFQIVKSVLAAVVVSLVFALVFTVIIQLFNLPTSVVKPVNQVFKILSVAIGGIIFIRGERGLLKGIIHGVLSVILTFLIFGAISLSLSADWKFALEILFGAISGGIAGVIAVNIKRKA